MSWLRFNAVGIAGAIVQWIALAILSGGFGIADIPATLLAVEIALLHNFLWHEVWTFEGLPAADRWRRLLRFHLANGLISLASNAVLTWEFERLMHWHVLRANVAAVVVVSPVNFGLARAWVFRDDLNAG